MQKRFFWAGIFALLVAPTFSSCISTPSMPDNIDTIMHSDGINLGTVSASAAITEDRATGEIAGDTMKYGFIENTVNRSNSRAREMIDAATSNAMEMARANALYDIIQQVKEKGGNAITDVVSNIQRDYDPETRIETVTAAITATAIKTDK